MSYEPTRVPRMLVKWQASYRGPETGYHARTFPEGVVWRLTRTRTTGRNRRPIRLFGKALIKD